MGQGRSTVFHLNDDHELRITNGHGTVGVRNHLYDLVHSFVPGRRHHHNEIYSSDLINAIIENDFDYLVTKMGSLDSGMSEHDIGAITSEVEDFRDGRGWNVFHYAAHHQSQPIMERLVKYLKDADSINGKSTDDQNFTALHLAVQSGTDNDGLVMLFLKHPKIDVNATDADDWTPLHHACHRGLTKTVMALCLQSANFCCLNHEENSPLHLAASNQHTDIFSALNDCELFHEKYHGNPDFLDLKDQDGNNLLHLAVDNGETKMIEWCLKFGFNVTTRNKSEMNCMHIAARRGNYDVAVRILNVAAAEVKSLVNSEDSVKSTPLYLAAKFGNQNIMELLLDNGADMESRTSMRFTPLLAGIRYTKPKPVLLLLSRGANVMARDKRRHYNALLWAVEIQNLEILKMLLSHVSQNQDILQRILKETDNEKNTPHHIAAKAKNLDVLKTLMQYNTSCLEKKNRKGFTPFHIAVCEGKPVILNYIINNGISATYILDAHGSSGLHLAAEFGHEIIVERLLKFCSDNTIGSRNYNGWTPIHLASKNGHLRVLELLLQHSPLKETCEILDHSHCTALYLACAKGWPMCVDLLIKWGAMVTYDYHHHGKDKSMSCLNAAIDYDHFSVVSTILKSKQWHQALQFCSSTEDKDAETPIRKLVKKMPAAAKLAFDRCVKEEKVADESGCYYFKVHYNYDFVEDFQELFSDEGPKVQDDIGEKEVSSQTHMLKQDSKVLRRQDTQAFIIPNKTAVRKSTSTSTMKREFQTTETHFQNNEPTATPRKQYAPWGPKKFNYQNHPLHLMIIHKRQELLKHNLIASFIHYKWNMFGRWVYYPNVAFYTLLMLLLTVYMYLRFDYSKLLIQMYEKQTNMSLSLSDCLQNITLDSLRSTDDDAVEKLHSDKERLIICSVVIIINCVARITMEILQIIHHRHEYFLHFINYMEGILYVATIVFVSNFQLHCLPSWQWQLGAMCIFLSWINFILFLSEQPVVGIYIVMFQDIIKTFLHMAPMAILLVLAFGQPFFMLLSVIDAEVEPQQFITFPYSLLKTLSMTTGELETDLLFFSTPSVITYPVITYLLWIIFLIIMPMLFQNLLVGLAVDDIKSVQEKAALKKEALQIEFILDIFSRTPKSIVRWRNNREYIRIWGRGPIDTFWKWLNGSYWKPELKQKNEYNVALKVDKMSELISAMDRRIQSLSDHSMKLERLILHFSHEQERYLEPEKQEQLHRARRYSDSTWESRNGHYRRGDHP